MLFYILYVLNISILFLTLILMWLSFSFLFSSMCCYWCTKPPEWPVLCLWWLVFLKMKWTLLLLLLFGQALSFKGFLKNIYHVGRDCFQSLSSHLSSVYAAFTVFHYKRRKTQTIQPYQRRYCIFVPCFVVTLFFFYYFFFGNKSNILETTCSFCAHIFFYLVMK